MEMIKIPHTDLEASRLALGCMGLGGGWKAHVQLTKDHERQPREFLDAAEEIGANFFDHANIYGRGRATAVAPSGEKHIMTGKALQFILRIRNRSVV
jgi:aryl-alcohol dehydrogenase-like predicted oxidoreductase